MDTLMKMMRRRSEIDLFEEFVLFIVGLVAYIGTLTVSKRFPNVPEETANKIGIAVLFIVVFVGGFIF